MTTSLYKKGMVLGIIALFVGTSIIPSITPNMISTVKADDPEPLDWDYHDDFDNSWQRWKKTWSESLITLKDGYIEASGWAWTLGGSAISKYPNLYLNPNEKLVGVDVKVKCYTNANFQSGTMYVEIRGYKPDGSYVGFTSLIWERWYWGNSVEYFETSYVMPLSLQQCHHYKLEVWVGREGYGGWNRLDDLWVNWIKQGIEQDIPIADFTWTGDGANPDYPVPGDNITFDASDSYDPDNNPGDPNNGIVLYEWDFNEDGVCDKTGKIVTWQYTDVGSHQVRLKVKDDEDSTDMITKDVKVAYLVNDWHYYWKYPDSHDYDHQIEMHDYYTIHLNVTNIKDYGRIFNTGLDRIDIKPMSPLGHELWPENIIPAAWLQPWNLNEEYTCYLDNSEVNIPISISDTIGDKESKEYMFAISNNWSWIPSWDSSRIQVIALALLDPTFFGVDILVHLTTWMFSIPKIEYKYEGLSYSAQHSSGNVLVWTRGEKIQFLRSSLDSMYLASAYTLLAILFAPVPIANIIAAIIFGAAEGYFIATSEIEYTQADDPDADFNELVSPKPSYIPHLDDDIQADYIENLELSSNLPTISEACLRSYAKYLGALTARSAEWATIQLASTKYYMQKKIDIIKEMLLFYETNFPNVPSPTPGNISNIRNSLSQDGLPDTEVAILRHYGFTDEEIDDIVQELVSANDGVYYNLLSNFSSFFENHSHFLEETLEHFPEPPNKSLFADIDVDPMELDLYNPPNIVTCYLEFLTDDNTTVLGINSSSVNSIEDALSISQNPGDYDSDGIPDYAVSFNGSNVSSMIGEGKRMCSIFGNITVNVTEIMFGEKVNTTMTLFYSGSDLVTGIGFSPETLLKVGYPKYVEDDKLWVTSQTEFNLTATDDFSEIAYSYYRIWGDNQWCEWIKYKGNFTVSGDGEHKIEYYSVDNAGNVEEVHNQTHYVDDSAPITNIDPEKPCYITEKTMWVTSHTPLYINAMDRPEQHCGVKDTWYKINDGKWTKYTGPFSLEKEQCNYHVSFYSEDCLGNTEKIKTQIVHVDDTPPTSDINYSQPYFDDWEGILNDKAITPDDGLLKVDPEDIPLFVTTDTHFQLTAEDKGKCPVGVGDIFYRTWNLYNGWSDWTVYKEEKDNPYETHKKGFTLNYEGLHYIEYYAEDLLGNTEKTVHNLSCMVDDTPPRTVGYGYMSVILDATDYGGKHVSDILPFDDIPEFLPVWLHHIHYRYKIGEHGKWTEWQTEDMNRNVRITLGKGDPFGVPIYVDYYAVDILGNTEETHHDVFTNDPFPGPPIG